MNSFDKCCSHRDDDCFIINLEEKCYCDLFCDRSRALDQTELNKWSKKFDCCEDAFELCIAEPSIVNYRKLNNTKTKTTTPKDNCPICENGYCDFATEKCICYQGFTGDLCSVHSIIKYTGKLFISTFIYFQLITI